MAGWYNERLADEDLIALPYIEPATTRMSWFVYVVRVKPPAKRDVVMHRLAEVGIPSRHYFSPIHLQSFYREKFGYKPGDFPVAEAAAREVLSLPVHQNLAPGDVERVVSAMVDFFSQ